MTVKRNIIVLVASTCLPVLAGCGVGLSDLFASLGGGRAGTHGTVRVVLINNTPHRAVFTYGTYDHLDQFSEPDFGQFGLNPDGVRTLNGDESTEVAPMRCARTFSIGGPRLLDMIERNLRDVAPDEDAFVEGVRFYELDAGDERAEPQEPIMVAAAPAFEARLGVDFACESLLIIRFEFDDLSPEHEFRVDFELIPSESTR